MSDLVDRVTHQLKTKVLSVWPDLTGEPQIYFGEDVSSIDFTRIAEPYSIFNVAPWKRDRSWGMDNNAFTSLITIYYVRAIQVTQDELRQRLHLLQRYLDRPEQSEFDTTGQWEGAMIQDVEDLAHDRYLPLNQEFEDRQVPLRAGGVGVNVLKWEHASRD